VPPVPQWKRWNAGSKGVEGLDMWLRGNGYDLCNVDERECFFGLNCKLRWWNGFNVIEYVMIGFVGWRVIPREVERIEGVSWLFDTCQCQYRNSAVVYY
jgi:hypothetical protein